MSALEKMEEVKKPASKNDTQNNASKKSMPTPLFLLLCHIGCIAAFILCMLADWALGDVQAQNITGASSFLLPVALAAVIILWEKKLPSNARLRSPAVILCCFIAIALIWIVVYSQFSGMRQPAALSPDAPKDLLWKEYQNDIRLSLFAFGLFYTIVDSAILLVYFVIRWIVSMIREKKEENTRNSKKTKKGRK